MVHWLVFATQLSITPPSLKHPLDYGLGWKAGTCVKMICPSPWLADISPTKFHVQPLLSCTTLRTAILLIEHMVIRCQHVSKRLFLSLRDWIKSSTSGVSLVLQKVQASADKSLGPRIAKKTREGILCIPWKIPMPTPSLKVSEHDLGLLTAKQTRQNRCNMKFRRR